MLPASLTKVYYLFSHWKPYSVLPPLAHQRSASVPDSGHIRKTGSGTSIGPVCKSGPAQTWLPDSGRILFAIWDPKLMCTLDIFACIFPYKVRESAATGDAHFLSQHFVTVLTFACSAEKTDCTYPTFNDVFEVLDYILVQSSKL
ncbi:hypothetical protein GQR58_007929 [Nymphon striatum]|nr:hypothetical protein GQR58_007929 [Nymphon striatum]